MTWEKFPDSKPQDLAHCWGCNCDGIVLHVMYLKGKFLDREGFEFENVEYWMPYKKPEPPFKKRDVAHPERCTLNSAECGICGDVLISLATKHFVACQCWTSSDPPGIEGIAIDGGIEKPRAFFSSMEDLIDHSEYS